MCLLGTLTGILFHNLRSFNCEDVISHGHFEGIKGFLSEEQSVCHTA